MPDQILSHAIAKALAELEQADDLVITLSSSQRIVDHISNAVLGVVPNTGLSREELAGVRSLIFHAIADKRFFDWEMPTLTGFKATEFEAIAEKMPSE